MSQHSALKKPGSTDSRGKRKISWGTDQEFEFSKDLSPSARNIITGDLSQQSPKHNKVLVSPSAPNPITPIHHNMTHLSPVTEENRSDYSQDSILGSQKSLNNPYAEPARLHVSWILPQPIKNLNKTPKKNSQTQRIIAECKENIEKEGKNLVEVEKKVQEYEENKKKMEQLLWTFNKEKGEILDRVIRDKKLSTNKFLGALNYYENFNSKTIIDSSLEQRWVKIDEKHEIYKHNSNFYDNPLLTNLILKRTGEKFILQALMKFNHFFLEGIWEDFKKFLQAQEYKNVEEMLIKVSEQWYFFIKFYESFLQLDKICEIKGIQGSGEFCIVTGECCQLPWSVTIKFQTIAKDWDIFTQVQNALN